MMEPHPLFNSSNALATLCKVTRSSLATKEFASSTSNEKDIAEWEVAVNNVTGPAVGSMVDRSSQPRPPLALSLSYLMDSAALTLHDISRLFKLHKHRFIFLPQNVDARLEGPPRSTIDHRMDIPINDRKPSNSTMNFWWSSVTYHLAPAGPLPFPNTPFSANTPPHIGVEGVPSIPPAVSDSPALLKNREQTSSLSPRLYYPGVPVQETILTPLYRVVDFWSYLLPNTRQMILLHEARCFRDTKERVVRLCLTLGNFWSGKPIVLLTFLAYPMDIFDNICVLDDKAVWFPTYLLSDGAIEV